MKKGLIIGGTAIVIAASSIAGGYLLAEKIIGPPGANENTVISVSEKEKLENQQRDREQWLLQQATEENNRELERQQQLDMKNQGK
ncbi:hypothetical protein NDK43_06855 [Neobacillus pocheonensis]|uniref:Uncharacterized protein n=1 Tax=Neobacillus pocheonensis TaxID=363869 RepID=A0ABT0W9N5_9BACI|nr:hypothetical protein [Neobacillus pocheonensis]